MMGTGGFHAVKGCLKWFTMNLSETFAILTLALSLMKDMVADGLQKQLLFIVLMAFGDTARTRKTKYTFQSMMIVV